MPAAAAAPPSRSDRRSKVGAMCPLSSKCTHPQRTPRWCCGTLVPLVTRVRAVTWDFVKPDAAAQGWDLPGFEAWLSGRSAATQRAYLGDMAAFAEWVARSDVEEPAGVDRLLLRRYLASLGTRRLARATVARKAAALRCYFSWQVRQGHLGSDPARSLRAPSGGGRLPRVLSGGEMTSLLHVPTGDAVDRRDLAVLELLYAAGLRVSELCGLDRTDVDLRGRTVTVLGKGNKQRRLPIHDAAVAAL